MTDGQVLAGRYELGAVLGRGGMAEVRAGRDLRLGRAVAVKTLLPDLASQPATVSAVCTGPSGKTITVTWSAVAHATSYSIYQTTTSATSGYSLTASGVTGTSWTSATLSNATYWFEVGVSIGTNWVSPNSTATAPHTVTGNNCA